MVEPTGAPPVERLRELLQLGGELSGERGNVLTPFLVLDGIIGAALGAAAVGGPDVPRLLLGGLFVLFVFVSVFVMVAGAYLLWKTPDALRSDKYNFSMKALNHRVLTTSLEVPDASRTLPGPTPDIRSAAIVIEGIVEGGERDR